jgi:hypothetical protein
VRVSSRELIRDVVSFPESVKTDSSFSEEKEAKRLLL